MYFILALPFQNQYPQLHLYSVRCRVVLQSRHDIFLLDYTIHFYIVTCDSQPLSVNISSNVFWELRFARKICCYSYLFLKCNSICHDLHKNSWNYLYNVYDFSVWKQNKLAFCLRIITLVKLKTSFSIWTHPRNLTMVTIVHHWSINFIHTNLWRILVYWAK